MDAIQQHIDNMFHDLPETEEILRIKNDLYLNALDRRDELLATGKTESEALGTIIIEMGEHEVLLEEFGYNQEQDLKGYSLNSLEEAIAFVEINKQESYKIALGVLMILVGGGLIATLSTFALAEIGVIILMILVAAAVGLFIMSGMRMEAAGYDENVGEIFYMSDDDYEVAKYEFARFKQKNRFRIPLGVMLCILSPLPLIALSFIGDELYIERFGVILLTTLVGIGVTQFITYGMPHSAFEKILNIGEYSAKEQRFRQKIEPIAGIYWTTMTLIYLAWSFITMGWDFTWIVWPIAGVLWALISLFLKLSIDREDHY